MRVIDPMSAALFLMAGLSLAGIAQTVWLRSKHSARLAIPLDGGRSLAGARILGDHKTLRGFVMMVPATALSFLVLALLLAPDATPTSGLWPIPPVAYLGLGAWAGLGFMLGELPNSFLKRQLGIAPGAAPSGAAARAATFVLDRLDSIVGMLALVALAVPLPARAWLYVLVVGPAIHWGFSVALYLAGGKGRPS